MIKQIKQNISDNIIIYVRNNSIVEASLFWNRNRVAN